MLNSRELMDRFLCIPLEGSEENGYIYTGYQWKQKRNKAKIKEGADASNNQ